MTQDTPNFSRKCTCPESGPSGFGHRIGDVQNANLATWGKDQKMHGPVFQVAAVCVRSARTVLCGGQSAMSVPTATLVFSLSTNHCDSLT